MKKRSERCKHCVLTVVRRSQKFSPHCRPLPGGVGRPKFNQLEIVYTFTYRPSLAKMDAQISSYCDNRPTHTNTHKQTHRQDRLQYTAPLSLARSVNITVSLSSMIVNSVANYTLDSKEKQVTIHAISTLRCKCFEFPVNKSNRNSK